MPREMTEEELKKVAATYFGTGPAMKANAVNIEIVEPADCEEKMKVKWEEHIGAKSGVARISALDVLHMLNLPCTADNMDKAVKLMRGIAKKDGAQLIKVDDEKYLLINPKYRR